MASADSNLETPYNGNPRTDSVDAPRNRDASYERMLTNKDDEYYSMDYSIKNGTRDVSGLAIILNHENFEDDLRLNVRSGTDVDFKRLQHTLTGLRFDIWWRCDQTKEEIDKIVAKAVNHDHGSYSALIVVVLTHCKQGTRGNRIYAKDRDYQIDNLWLPFTGDRCKGLAGKPKLFFIQACDGDKRNSSSFSDQTDTGARYYRIPVQSDFFIAVSTVPGYFFWRNDKSKGSLFIEALCTELDENGFHHDLQTIMTLVNMHVQSKVNLITPHQWGVHLHKQTPSVTSMLLHKVKFRKHDFGTAVNEEEMRTVLRQPPQTVEEDSKPPTTPCKCDLQ